MHFLAQKEWFRGENRVFSGKNGGKKSKISCIFGKKVVPLWAENKKISEGMGNRCIIMAKNTNAFGKLNDEVYASHAPGKPENVGYMKSMPPKRKGKKRPATTVRQNEALKQANARVSEVMKDPVLRAESEKEFEKKYAKRGMYYMKKGKWVRRRLVDYVREREMKKIRRK